MLCSESRRFSDERLDTRYLVRFRERAQMGVTVRCSPCQVIPDKSHIRNTWAAEAAASVTHGLHRATSEGCSQLTCIPLMT